MLESCMKRLREKSFLRETTEAFAQNLAALHDQFLPRYDQRSADEAFLRSDHVGAVEGDVEHLALGTLV